MEKHGSGRPTILIVERDQSVRKLQVIFLEREGFSVELADDGRRALDRVSEGMRRWGSVEDVEAALDPKAQDDGALPNRSR